MENQTNTLVLSMLGYLAQRDVPLQKLCSVSGIDLKLLKKKSHPPINDRQFSDLWRNAIQLTNDSLLGLHFGESLQLAALGIVGEIIKSSRTVGEAITFAAGLVHLISDQFKMEVHQSRQKFAVLIKATLRADKSDFAFLQMRDLLMVFLIHELDGLLLEKIKPSSATLPFEREHSAEYERVLRCRPTNKANECLLEFPIVYWNEPILTANYELQGQLMQKVQLYTKGQKQTQTLQYRIKSFLMANAYLGVLSLEEVAANFNLSPRTLQRKLSEEGITFQKLADEVRQNLAEHYLTSGDYQVKEISNMLGYNELSAFSRAFKRWTGKSPNSYQTQV